MRIFDQQLWQHHRARVWDRLWIAVAGKTNFLIQAVRRNASCSDHSCTHKNRWCLDMLRVDRQRALKEIDNMALDCFKTHPLWGSFV
ncbi:hypothetical protein RSP781_15795 [Ralstonia pseudosolanacearum]|nr:hypothetical protein RSP781_15795 [Ralstonia pseudosolanacearum]